MTYYWTSHRLQGVLPLVLLIYKEEPFTSGSNQIIVFEDGRSSTRSPYGSQKREQTLSIKGKISSRE